MDRAIGRRDVLRGAGVVAAAGALGGLTRSAGAEPIEVENPLLFHSPAVEKFVDELPRIPVVRGSRLEIDASTTTHKFHRDLPEAPAFGYSGQSYLGPTIEHHRDEPLHVRFSNTIESHPFAADLDTSIHGVQESWRTAPPTSLHLHGGVTPPDSDGHPENTVMPGQSIDHRYPLRQEAGMLWYHDHPMGITRTNVYAGLAGMMLLRDEFDTGESDNTLGLPSGEFEMPLVLQEKIFRPDGQQNIRTTSMVPEGRWEGGGAGDAGVVNGKLWPRMPVARGLYRFRTINAAQFSTWNLFFSNRMRFWVIGTEHGLLDAPVPVQNFRLAAGERIDLLVDFSGLAPGESVELRNDEEPVFQARLLGQVAMPVFCRFTVEERRGFTGAVPERLRGERGQLAVLPGVETPTVVRDITLSQPYELRVPPAIMTLNNLRYSDPDIEMPRQGTVEQWNFINITPDPHPIHIHLVTFRILDRTPLRTLDYQAANIQPPIGIRWNPSAEGFLAGPPVPAAPWERGWKDIVRVDGGTVTRILVRIPTADELGFDPDASFTPLNPAAGGGYGSGGGGRREVHNGVDHSKDLRGYVWHCHILDHEDHDMMLRLRFVP
ncbi:multicopper oxidase domain-containing protein [Nocardia higoensis]|uniref:Multicopper oxidase domain-containing protein n=1 Tax=Nocardia higoensis TaxID=228599 RepID=A0ABS0D6Y2_9NOCA|nr:multicopper oxidase domain-containing protein [Nocardia higoensis]MBF6353840.1 multicopper oxidase domain-containing protein [Nocardia higoensis]